MNNIIHHVTVKIENIIKDTDRVNVYILSDPDQNILPPFTAGAHIDLHLPNGMVRQYSLTGKMIGHKQYKIAVQKEINGRGGSVYIHENLKIGDIIPISLPRNLFPIQKASRKHILIAGGIGITPFIPMVQTLEKRGEDFELHYCCRNAESTPLYNILKCLIDKNKLHIHHDDGDTNAGLDIRDLLSKQQYGEHAYCCGPSGMVRAFKDATKKWSKDSVHCEYFGADNNDNVAYEIEIASTGQIIPVIQNQSMLTALRAKDINIEASCEAGICLQCKTKYLDGNPQHRDMLLSPEDRKCYITPCVSSCQGGRMILDL